MIFYHADDIPDDLKWAFMSPEIGLEASPQAWVDSLLAVFREIRRVLTDDGTLWVNCGDSYASQGGAGAQGQSGQRADRTFTLTREGGTRPPDGLKAKDLIGLPWLLAFALRAPEYKGRILREIDRVWLAAMIDAEGCIFIHKRKAGQSNGQGYERKNDNYAPGLEVANCSEAVVKQCLKLTGLGSICSQSPDQNNRRRQTIFRWNLRTVECRDILREVYPYLVAKQHQARLAIGCPSSGVDAERAHAGLIGLHSGIACGIDFSEPEPMFGPGWYLRSDIIWKKPNPMPESVIDRPTKSHEYIFLLSKNPRYYFDAGAIAEESSTEPHSRGGVEKPGQTDGPMNRNGCGQYDAGQQDRVWGSTTRNARSVWTIPTQGYSGAHFATFPRELAARCIKAGSAVGDLVLDPFGGTGTTVAEAILLGRRGLCIELNPEYAKLAEKRIADLCPLLATARLLDGVKHEA